MNPVIDEPSMDNTLYDGTGIAQLPVEVLASCFEFLGAITDMCNARAVCHTWCNSAVPETLIRLNSIGNGESNSKFEDKDTCASASGRQAIRTYDDTRFALSSSVLYRHFNQGRYAPYWEDMSDEEYDAPKEWEADVDDCHLWNWICDDEENECWCTFGPFQGKPLWRRTEARHGYTRAKHSNGVLRLFFISCGEQLIRLSLDVADYDALDWLAEYTGECLQHIRLYSHNFDFPPSIPPNFFNHDRWPQLQTLELANVDLETGNPLHWLCQQGCTVRSLRTLNIQLYEFHVGDRDQKWTTFADVRELLRVATSLTSLNLSTFPVTTVPWRLTPNNPQQNKIRHDDPEASVPEEVRKQLVWPACCPRSLVELTNNHPMFGDNQVQQLLYAPPISIPSGRFPQLCRVDFAYTHVSSSGIALLVAACGDTLQSVSLCFVQSVDSAALKVLLTGCPRLEHLGLPEACVNVEAFAEVFLASCPATLSSLDARSCSAFGLFFGHWVKQREENLMRGRNSSALRRLVLPEPPYAKAYDISRCFAALQSAKVRLQELELHTRHEGWEAKTTAAAVDYLRSPYGEELEAIVLCGEDEVAQQLTTTALHCCTLLQRCTGSFNHSLSYAFRARSLSRLEIRERERIPGRLAAAHHTVEQFSFLQYLTLRLVAEDMTVTAVEKLRLSLPPQCMVTCREFTDEIVSRILPSRGTQRKRVTARRDNYYHLLV